MADREPEFEVERAATRLSADYARLIDNRDAAGWSELFTLDGCMDLGDRKIVGRDALREFAVASARGVHVPGLLAVTTGDGTITCESPFIYVNTCTGQVIAGYYRDQLTWQGDRLVFVVRQVDRRAYSPVVA